MLIALYAPAARPELDMNLPRAQEIKQGGEIELRQLSDLLTIHRGHIPNLLDGQPVELAAQPRRSASVAILQSVEGSTNRLINRPKIFNVAPVWISYGDATLM